MLTVGRRQWTMLCVWILPRKLPPINIKSSSQMPALLSAPPINISLTNHKGDNSGIPFSSTNWDCTGNLSPPTKEVSAVNLSGKRQDEEIAQSERSMDPKNFQLGYSESQISKSNYFMRHSAFHSYTKRPVSFKASSSMAGQWKCQRSSRWINYQRSP